MFTLILLSCSFFDFFDVFAELVPIFFYYDELDEDDEPLLDELDISAGGTYCSMLVDATLMFCLMTGILFS